MNDKVFAVIGRVFIIVLVYYIVMWLLLAALTTLSLPRGYKEGKTLEDFDTATLVCRVSNRIPLFPAIVMVSDAPPEFCRKE